MKKSHKFDELSEIRCGCGKRLKLRLVKTKAPHKIRSCYKCGLKLKKEAQRMSKYLLI